MTKDQFNQLRAASGLINLDDIVAWANDPKRSGRVTGTTPPDLQPAHDPDEIERLTIVKEFLALTGLTEELLENREKFRAVLKQWYLASKDEDKADFAIQYPLFLDTWNTLKDELATIDPDAKVDVGSQPIYGESWSERNGFANGITRDMIEEALKSKDGKVVEALKPK